MTLTLGAGVTLGVDCFLVAFVLFFGAGAFLAGAFLAEAFFPEAFFAGDFLAGDFLAGAVFLAGVAFLDDVFFLWCSMTDIIVGRFSPCWKSPRYA